MRERRERARKRERIKCKERIEREEEKRVHLQEFLQLSWKMFVPGASRLPLKYVLTKRNEMKRNDA